MRKEIKMLLYYFTWGFLIVGICVCLCLILHCYLSVSSDKRNTLIEKESLEVIVNDAVIRKNKESLEVIFNLAMNYHLNNTVSIKVNERLNLHYKTIDKASFLKHDLILVYRNFVDENYNFYKECVRLIVEDEFPYYLRESCEWEMHWGMRMPIPKQTFIKHVFKNVLGKKIEDIEEIVSKSDIDLMRVLLKYRSAYEDCLSKLY